MQPVEIDLLPQTAGDTWEGLTIGPMTVVGGGALPSPAASCRLQFIKNKQVEYELNNAPGAGQGTITITDADTWSFSIAAHVLPLESGTYSWRFRLTTDSGLVITPYAGKITIL